MKTLAGSLFGAVVLSAPLFGQERDRSLERISLALEHPPSIVGGAAPVESGVPKTLGIITFVPPTLPGEMVRVSVPIGELVSRALKGVAAANRRRQETVARRKVEAALEQFKQQVGVNSRLVDK